MKAFRITLKKHFELLRYITFADWLKNFLFHVQAENNQAAAGSLFSYNMHRHMERHTHTHAHKKFHPQLKLNNPSLNSILEVKAVKRGHNSTT